uniref:Uncharacterized protein n=1 Tax=Monopterus albus TaxID=43700 RepID=A0A3Q3QF36_MONAL|nr:uncharacterized protein LOC109972410 isoform X2 [Monopterus albus]
MMNSIITSTYEIPQPVSQDLQPASQNPQPASQDPQPASQDLQPVSQDLQPASQDTQPASQDPQPAYKGLNGLMPAVTDGSQAEVKAKPVPRPRSILYPKAQSNNSTDDSVDKTSNTTKAVSSKNSGDPAVHKKPHPVRPPPPRLPPAAVSIEKIQNHPPRPERPPPPSIYHDRLGPATRTQSKTCTEESQQPISSEQTPGSPALSKEVEDLCKASVGDMATGRPAVPPRPKSSLRRSASMNEFSPPQIRPTPFSRTPQPSMESVYNQPEHRTNLGVRPVKEDKMMTRPPPPLFKPPPPPSTESLYSEIEDRPYLEVLPVEEDKMMKQKRSSWPHSGRYQSGLSVHQRPTEDSDDINGMLRWLKKVSKPDYMTPSLYGLSIEEEIRLFNQRAMDLSKALRLYNLLMMKRHECFRSIITEFVSISDSLDKMQKKTKTMDIAGGTTGAVGGVTAVVGIALAPVTLGASLIATAVGAGMVASAGGMSVHTAKANRKIVNRMTVEKLVYDYKSNVVDLEHCLDFILSGMNELRRHDIPRLHRAGAQADSLKMAHLSQSVFRINMNHSNKTSVAHTGRMSSEKLLLDFVKEMDQYFTEKDSGKLKKLSKSKFSGRVRLLAKNLQDELEHLNHMWEMFS